MTSTGRITVVTALFGLAIIGLAATFVLRYPSKPLLADNAVASNSLHPTTTFVDKSGDTNLISAFAQAGVSYYPEDKVATFPSPDLGIGSVITVTRALPVTVVDGNTSTVQRTWASTVGDLISEKNIILGNNDKISPALDVSLTSDMTITITRVAVTIVSETTPIAFTSVNQNDPTLNQGTTKIGQVGINGVRTLNYTVTRQNGVQISKVLSSSSVTTAPQQQITLIGTKPYIHVSCAGYDSTVLAAAIRNSVDPNLLCKGIIIESKGHANSVNSGGYSGLFQYDPSFWATISAKAGYAGANILDATAQINVTAYALAHGYNSRWWWA